MALNDILEDIEFESAHEKWLEQFEAKRKLAIKWNWNFSNFKRLISQFIKRENSEDQWVFDYESYVETLKPEPYVHPLVWAKEFYWDDFHTEKYEKSLESLKKTVTDAYSKR